MENKLEVLNHVTNLKGLSNAPNSDEISMNPFSDLLNSEFSQMMNGAIPSEPKEFVKGNEKKMCQGILGNPEQILNFHFSPTSSKDLLEMNPANLFYYL